MQYFALSCYVSNSVIFYDVADDVVMIMLCYLISPDPILSCISLPRMVYIHTYIYTYLSFHILLSCISILHLIGVLCSVSLYCFVVYYVMMLH